MDLLSNREDEEDCHGKVVGAEVQHDDFDENDENGLFGGNETHDMLVL